MVYYSSTFGRPNKYRHDLNMHYKRLFFTFKTHGSMKRCWLTINEQHFNFWFPPLVTLDGRPFVGESEERVTRRPLPSRSRVFHRSLRNLLPQIDEIKKKNIIRLN